MTVSPENEILLKFVAINVCSGIAIGLINLIIPLYALSLNATSTEIGLIKGISSVGDLLIVLPAGILVDYLGARKLYVLSCLLGGLTVVLLSFAGSVNGLILLMVAYGAMRTVRSTALSASFFKYMDRISARKMGWYRGSMGIGTSFIGPALGGLLAAAISFTSFFLATAAILVAPLLMFAATTVRRKGGQKAAGRPRANVKSDLSYYWKLLRNRDLVLMTLTDSICVSFYMTFLTFMIVLVVRDLEYSAMVAALLIALRGGSNMVVVFTCGSLLRLDHHKLYIASMLGTTVGLLLMGTTSDIALLSVASLITGICTGILSLLTISRVGSIRGEKGKIAGFNSFGVSFGNIAGPILGGVIADLFGIPAIFLGFAVCFMALTLFAARGPNRISGQCEAGSREAL